MQVSHGYLYLTIIVLVTCFKDTNSMTYRKETRAAITQAAEDLGHLVQDGQRVPTGADTDRSTKGWRVTTGADTHPFSQGEGHVALISSCPMVASGDDVMVNCSLKDLSQIPSTLPQNASTLLLDFNHISNIANMTFVNFTRLHNLTIRYNIMETFDMDAFKGLDNLKVLDLEYNRLRENIHSNLSYLKSLTELRIRQEDGGLNVTSLLENLTCQNFLEILSVNTHGDTLTFDPRFLKFTKLTRLEFSGAVKYITNTSFLNVKHIRELYIFDLEHISHISQGAFEPLRKLEVLHLHIVPYGIRRILRLLWPFAGRNMTSIYMERVSYGITTSDGTLLRNDSYLDSSITKYLTSICLKRFLFLNNQIYIVIGGALWSRLWDSCLEEISLTKNPLVGTRIFFLRLFSSANIRTLRIDDTFRAKFEEQFNWRNFFQMTRTETKSREFVEMVNNTSIIPQNFTSTEHSRNSPNQINSTITTDFKKLFGLNIFISKSLIELNIRRLIQSYTFNIDFTVGGAEGIELMDLSDSGLAKFEHLLFGFTGLRFLDLSSNDLSVVSERWFDTMPSLETLVLSNCFLDNTFMSVRGSRLLGSLRHLQNLDMSSNSLTMFDVGMFRHNSNITMLRISDNRFKTVPFSLHYTPHLRFLDISNNVITSLDVETRQIFDRWAENPQGFNLNIGGNILSCTCESLNFLLWLKTTHVQLGERRVFPCMNEAGQLTNTSTYNNLDGLWRRCWGEYFFYLSLVLLCIIVIGFLLTFVVNKKLTFITHFIIQNFGGFKFKTAADYKIGVYIGYADRDYRFACHPLREFIEDKLHMTSFLRDRDLLPCLDTARGIVEAINSSWRILLVYNPQFLHDDDWMMFTFRAAVYAQTPANPARVVVLVDERHVYKLPTELLSAVTEDSIIVVEDWQMTYDLKQALKTRLSPT